MMGSDKELRELSYKATVAGHTGFCLGTYNWECGDCPTEMECLKLFLKETQDERHKG